MKRERIPNLGEFEFYKGYFVGRIYEGVNADETHVEALSSLIRKYYAGAPVIYISDRVNSYSLDPIATKKLIKINNIKYALIIMHKESQKASLPVEKMLINNVVMKSFDSIELAKAWAEDEISKNSAVMRIYS